VVERTAGREFTDEPVGDHGDAAADPPPPRRARTVHRLLLPRVDVTQGVLGFFGGRYRHDVLQLLGKYFLH
jgi:hypothetical protein